MKRIIVLMLTLGCLSLSCTDKDDDVNEVNIRIKNVSNLTFDQVQVGEAETLHMNISPDDYSEYLIYDIAYRYAYIQITTGAETYTLQPIDFVGETALPIGFYTYELDVTEEGNVNLNFVID
ncbi:hypothetical protein [Muriicola sp. Z0-33]|uniref:hypothetical protein n=1 Tax=Muriicola sp. Z0-33 TaxID=2816957 RepID=UPI002238121C|nr:hypothetical protein [Muriicola sp. Z0-33]MCW5517740.1 hypothetical protein [Muriicola sp. Z0-33]